MKRALFVCLALFAAQPARAQSRVYISGDLFAEITRMSRTTVTPDDIGLSNATPLDAVTGGGGVRVGALFSQDWSLELGLETAFPTPQFQARTSSRFSATSILAGYHPPARGRIRAGFRGGISLMHTERIATSASISGAMAAPGPSSSLFSSYEVVPLQLKAPFNDLIDKARTNDDYAVTGTLSYTDGGREVTIEGVKVSLRGHTSKREGECAFPKLKLDLPADKAGQGTLLSGLRSLKIGTHCGDAAADTVTEKYGRLANEHSPLREAFVYRLLDAVGVPALKARPAKITYVFIDAPGGRSAAQTPPPVVRNGMLLESADAAVKRLGAERELDVKAFTDARAMFSTADTARLAFAEAMIGNFDWCLKMFPQDAYRCDARDPLWNIVAAATADGRARPLIYDFDIAGMVVGRHSWFKNTFNEAFVPSRSHTEIEVLAQVQRTRTLFNRADLDATRGGFVKRKAHAYEALESARLDSAGKRQAREYLDSFYKAIESDDAFYRPVVITPGTQLYANENRAIACASHPDIPVGTPVSEPLQKKGTLIQVVVLDALWNWAERAKCAAVQQAPMWIDASAVSADFPKK